jgi:hypothetical protein
MIAQDCLTAAMHTGAMSPQYNPGADSDLPVQDGESAGSAKAGWRVCAIVLLLFIAAAALSAMRKDVTQGFDEVAHASYVAHLQHTGETWPAFAEMRMLDPSSFRFTGDPCCFACWANRWDNLRAGDCRHLWLERAVLNGRKTPVRLPPNKEGAWGCGRSGSAISPSTR